MDRIRWAARLQPRLLERLYQSDARGLRDDELCDEVGIRLYERCRTFVMVSRREVTCPRCGEIFRVAREGESACPAPRCAWSTSDAAYRKSLKDHYAYTGRAIDAFAAFHRSYPQARSYADKIVLIDQLIHSFHLEEATSAPVKSVASKLLEGNKHEVVRFLDRLSAVDPGSKSVWREKVAGTIDARMLAPPENGD